MPGIVGIIASGPEELHRRQAGVMLRSLLHEPHYVSGIHACPELGVYSGWAAHAGSYAARQSTACDKQELSLAFAGECFPDAGTGPPSAAGPDILAAYARSGPGMLGDLNGLFSGVLVDRQRGRVVLFNDRYSGERLYVAERPGAIYFASEAKALLAVLPETRYLDDEGIAELLAYGSTCGAHSLFRNIVLLPGGSAWCFGRDRRPTRGRYFDVRDWEQQPQLPDREFESQFMDCARSVIPVYAIGGETVGLSITGGLDTRMIVACLPPDDPPLVCYTYGAMRGETLDIRIGRQVSRMVGFEHHTLRLSNRFLSDYGAYVDRTVLITDGNAGALSAHELHLSEMARPLSAIRLTGNFGGEILRGTSTLTARKISPEFVDKDFRPVFERALTRNVADHPVTRSAFQEVPMHLFGSMAAARSQLIFRSPYMDNALVKIAYRASQAARNSPRAALQLIAAASPALARIATDRGFSLGAAGVSRAIRRLFCEVTFKLDYLDKEGLSGGLIKMEPLLGVLSGLGLLGLHKYLPYRGWFRRELAGYLSDVLGTERAQAQPYWSRKFIRNMAREHAEGRANHLAEIHSVLTIESLQRVVVEGTRLSEENPLHEKSP